jgi:hypothetical protein
VGSKIARSVRLTDRIGIGVLTRLVPRDVIDEVLTETRSKERRSRLLPAHVVVYFILAMAIFHDGYEEVMRRLVGGLQSMHAWQKDWTVPTTGAISQARERLGEAPLKALFERVAEPLAVPGTPGAWLGGRRLMAIDGVKIDVPDTEANVQGLGRPTDTTRRPFPQVQVIGLGECGTHAVIAAEIGTVRVGEREMAEKLAPALEPGMLVIADRGFYGFQLWAELMAAGADLIFRVPANAGLPPGEVLPDGSYMSEIRRREMRCVGYRIPLSAVDDPRRATHIPVRVVEYAVGGQAGGAGPEAFRVITTILDPEDVTAAEIAAAYHERWEYEIALREIETQMLEPGSGLRSRTPELVRQELWGLLLAHYSIRAVMSEAAGSAGIDPDRLSFIRAINVVRRQVTDQAAFSPQETGNRHGDDDRRDPGTGK